MSPPRAPSELRIKPLWQAICSALAVLAVTMIPVLFLSRKAAGLLLDATQRDLVRYASAAAALVEGDAHKRLVDASQTGSPEYMRVLRPLIEMHKRSPEIAYLYTMVAREGKLHFILDTAVAKSEFKDRNDLKPSQVMEEFESASAEVDAATVRAITTGTVYVMDRPVQDPFGTFLTAVAPIFDSSGQPVAGLSVDIDLANFTKRLSGVRRATNAALAIALALALVVGWTVWTVRRRTYRLEEERTHALDQQATVEMRKTGLVRALGEIVYHYNAQTERIEWEGDCERIVGCSAGAMPATIDEWSTQIHPNDQERAVSNFRKAIESRRLYLAEYRYRKTNGEYVWIADRGVPSSEDGALYFDGVLLDISNIKSSEEKFRVVFEKSADALMLADRRGVFDCNDAAVRMLGCASKLDILHAPLDKFWPETQPDGRKRDDIGEEMVRVARERGFHRFEAITMRLDGSTFPVEITSTYVTIDGREVMLIAWHDLTAAKEAKEKIETSERRYRELVDNLHQVVYQSGSDGRLFFVNPAWRKITGHQPEDTVGRSFLDFIPIEDAESAWNSFLRVLNGEPGRSYRHLLRIRRKDGEIRWLEGNSRSRRNPLGAPIGTAGTLQDITERIQAENALIRAKEEAEAGNRAKGEFLAVVSHEIRTPLNGVLGFASLLSDTRLDGVQKDYLRTIVSCGNTLLTLLNDILDFSRMESGPLTLEREPFSVREPVEDTLELHARTAQQKGVELVGRIAADVPDTIVGDAGRLRQVLSNLVGNAAKFTDSGEIVVSVVRSQGADGEAALRVTVTDTGAGIDPNKIAGLFRPFVQADTSNSRRFGGVGLGLAISRRIVEAMGGTIEVASEQGKGTSFAITIPLLLPDQTVSELPAKSFGGRRVVAFGENVTAVEAVSDLLRRFDLEVRACCDADIAFAAIDRDPSVAFCVFDVPVRTTGSNDFSRVFQLMKERNIPLLRLEPLARGEALSSMYRQSIVLKPVRQASLLAAIAAALQPSAPPAPARRRGAGDSARDAAVREMAGKLRNLRVLVVEDNAVNVRLLDRLLRTFEVVPDVVTNGVDCLSAVAQKDYDLILMDVQMPGMDGCEATQLLRERNCAAWIVAVTAHAMPEDREKCLRAGMNDYLTKPIRPAEIAHVLEHFAAGEVVT